jgi:Flp pilus assembly protein TadD
MAGIGRRMNTSRLGILAGAILILTLAGGCGGAQKRATDAERKQAALLASEGQFALTLKDWPRAEASFLKAAQISPEGEYFLSLGAARVRLGRKAEAKAAYQDALRAFEAEADREPKLAGPWLKEAFVLAVLGRADDSRALIAKAAKRFPNDPQVRALAEPKGFEKMMASANFKDLVP